MWQISEGHIVYFCDRGWCLELPLVKVATFAPPCATRSVGLWVVGLVMSQVTLHTL